MDLRINADDPNNVSQKVLDEKETRKRLLKHSRLVGCEKDMLLLFNKYDKLLKNCTNEKERKDIAKMACLDVYFLLGKSGELYLDNQLVYKG